MRERISTASYICRLPKILPPASALIYDDSVVSWNLGRLDELETVDPRRFLPWRLEPFLENEVEMRIAVVV